MRRYAVLSVFVFLLSLFVSCSLIEPSEKKASLAIGLNVSLPESSFLQANSASHLLQFDEEPHIEDEEFNSIEYTADVTITWDGGVSMGSGKIKRAKWQEEHGDGNKASGTVAVINLPMNKTLFALIEIKDSDGDVLYSANKTLILAGEVTPITIDLAYSVDADGSINLKPETTGLLIKAEYGTQKDSDTSIETFNIEDGKELVFTCLNADGTKITENVTYEWRINGTNLNDDSTEDYNDTDSIAFNPKQCALVDIGGKNTVECFVKYAYVSSAKTVSCSRMFAFNFTEADSTQYIYPKKAGSDELYIYDCTMKNSYEFFSSNLYAFKDSTFTFLDSEYDSDSGNDIDKIIEYSYVNGVYSETSSTPISNYGLTSASKAAYDTDGYLWIYGQNSESNYCFVKIMGSEYKSVTYTISNSRFAIADKYFVYVNTNGNSEQTLNCMQINYTEGTPSFDTEIIDSKTITALGKTCYIVGIYPVKNGDIYKIYVLVNFIDYSNGMSAEEGSTDTITGGIAVATITETGFDFDKNVNNSIKIYGIATADTVSDLKMAPDKTIKLIIPTPENEKCQFYNPLGFYAIKEDELYIPDTGIYQKVDSDYNCAKYKSRIMKFNLKEKTVSVAMEDPSIVITLPGSGLINSLIIEK